MQKFPEKYVFKYPWREYQARVLRELDGHFDDQKLNVVAAPGSGKTVLGIEVMLRKNKPSIILSPTLAIRNQWADRLTELFVQQEKIPQWVSFDIRRPQLVTIITYQALHMAFKNAVGIKSEPHNDEELDVDDEQLNLFESKTVLPVNKAEGLLLKIKKQRIQTIILDEAHHLRSEWWQTLKFFVKEMKGIQTVALTATPPYDVPSHEWKNYQEICGPIDVEVGVPELVARGDLCPHQDYIVLSKPSLSEKKLLKKFRINVNQFMQSLYSDAEFSNAISNLPALQNPAEFTEEILDNVPYYLAAVSFIKTTGQELNEESLKILTGKKTIDLPKFNEEGAEILLSHVLYKDQYLSKNHPQMIIDLRKRLKSISAIERRQIQLRSTKSLQRLLRGSASKFDSINDIVRHEASNRQDTLRMVILADYIRKEYLTEHEEGKGQLNKIGVIPIFESIRRKNKNIINKIAVLTGTVMIIPASAVNATGRITQSMGIQRKNYKLSKLKHDNDYFKLFISGNKNHQKVALITALFAEGEINIIVGTAALLGEGWDAPTLNSLILASYVGSYMFSNQMRGRAIRIDQSRPDKVASIWHLVAVDVKDPYGDADYSLMQRRFKAFVGVAYDQPFIESGTKRLLLPKWSELKRRPKKIGHNPIGKYNAKVFTLSSQYGQWRQQWQDALKIAKLGKLAYTLDVPKERMPKTYTAFMTLESILLSLLSAALLSIIYIVANIQTLFVAEVPPAGAITITIIIIIVIILIYGYKILRLLRYVFKNGSIKKHAGSITETIIQSFYETKIIKTKPEHVLYRIEKVQGVWLILNFYGGTPHEQQLVINAFEQVIGKLNNPRYIIVRHSKLSLLKTNRSDYHSVPDLLAVKKDFAQIFAKYWGKHVGPNELIFTRNIEGRRLLLRARLKASSRAFLSKTERKEKWL